MDMGHFDHYVQLWYEMRLLRNSQHGHVLSDQKKCFSRFQQGVEQMYVHSDFLLCTGMPEYGVKLECW